MCIHGIDFAADAFSTKHLKFSLGSGSQSDIYNQHNIIMKLWGTLSEDRIWRHCGWSMYTCLSSMSDYSYNSSLSDTHSTISGTAPQLSGWPLPCLCFFSSSSSDAVCVRDNTTDFPTANRGQKSPLFFSFFFKASSQYLEQTLSWGLSQTFQYLFKKKKKML